MLALAAAGVLSSCGSQSSTAVLRPDQRPVQIGRRAGFELPAVSPTVARRAPIAGLQCRTAHRPVYGVHLELYAKRRVLILPAGIGVAPPQRRRGAYVLGGRCTYPLRTLEPTGVVQVEEGSRATLGQLFALWGQRLSADALAGFRGRLAAYVDGRPWSPAPTAIPLRRHAEIVLEIGGYVAPHPGYRFAPGL